MKKGVVAAAEIIFLQDEVSQPLHNSVYHYHYDLLNYQPYGFIFVTVIAYKCYSNFIIIFYLQVSTALICSKNKFLLLYVHALLYKPFLTSKYVDFCVVDILVLYI